MDKREFIAEVQRRSGVAATPEEVEAVISAAMSAVAEKIFNERQANLERALKDPTNAHRAGYEYGLQFSQNLVESLT